MSEATATSIEVEPTISLVSRALGPIEVPESAAFVMCEPLSGFDGTLRYAMIPYVRDDGSLNNAVNWLLALEPPFHAFVVTDPWIVMPDYAPEISDSDTGELGLRSFEDARVFAILTVPEGPDEAGSINLRAPIVLNVAARRAKQVVLLGDEYRIRHELRP